MTNELVPYNNQFNNIKIKCHWGFVKIYPPMPVFDNKGRITGYTQRIRDSNGRDELLQPIIKIKYED